MRTLIISSSLSVNSKSFILCNEVNKKLKHLGVKSEIIDAREIPLFPYHTPKSAQMNNLTEKISSADNLIIAMGVHNYSINAELLETIKSGTLNWHRFQNSIGNQDYWFISYLKTRNGLINILFWFIPSIFSIILTIILNKFYSSKKFKFNTNYLVFSLTVTILICFFKLIPLVNYYPWIPHCSIE